MSRRENQSESNAQLTPNELDALKQASAQGWLTVTSAMGDTVLTYWQRECERFAQPFAVIRVEPKRATLWVVLAPGREWNDAEQLWINAALADSIGVVVMRDHVRGFAEAGAAP